MVNDLVTLLPELILTALVLVIITVDLFLPRAQKWILTPLTVAGLILAGAACVVVWGTNEEVYNGFYVVDDLSVFLKATTIVIGILTTLFAPSYLAARRIPLGEFNTILVTALIGMCVLASSSDLITLFIGLELMVMPSYLLAGLHKTDRYSNEGGLKYFLLGSFASAILLFGVAWIYGLTGTTNIGEVAAALDGQMSGALLVAIAFLTVGGTFKIAAVPFHYWTPDAYQGAPTPITGFLSVGPKLGAFALLIRVFAEGLEPLRADWLGVFLVLTVLTMTVGNIVALTQTNVKRMLAYSSIAHTGYIMAGLAAYAATDDPAGHAGRDRVGPVLRPRLRRDEHRRVRDGGHAPARHASLWRPELVRRPGRAGTVARGGDGRPHAQPDRHPAHRRLLRQAVRPARHRRRRARVAGGHHRAQRRAGRLLLPARRGLHVHARPGARARAARQLTIGVPGAGALRRRRRAARHLPGCRPWPPRGFRGEPVLIP